EAGAVERSLNGDGRANGELGRDQLAGEAVTEHEAYRQYRAGRAELLKDYATSERCRRQEWLKNFGETLAEPCGQRDNCESGVAGRAQVDSAQHADRAEGRPFAINARVSHKKLGEGTVMRYEQEKVVILFDTAGYRSLVTDYVIHRKLLSSIS